jgi:hypothetical protein
MTKDKASTVAPPGGLPTTASAMATVNAEKTAAKADTETDAKDDAPPKKKRRSIFHIPFTHDRSDPTGPDPDPTPTPG